MKTKIVYLAHTQQRILDDAVFSILNLVYQGLENLDCEVIVGTDKPEFFASLPVTTWPITSTNITEWKGEINFIHRTKPVFLDLVVKRYPGCHLIYFDADTALKSELSVLLGKIDAGKAVMHASEGLINETDMAVYTQVRSKIADGTLDLDGLSESEMFNAGVIGIPASQTFILEKVIANLDKTYPKLRIHIIEQMLFSYYIGLRMQIIDSSSFAIHWWGKGLNTGPIISEFLNQTHELALPERALQANALIPKIESTPMNPKLSFFDKLKRSIKKRFH